MRHLAVIPANGGVVPHQTGQSDYPPVSDDSDIRHMVSVGRVTATGHPSLTVQSFQKPFKPYVYGASDPRLRPAV